MSADPLHDIMKMMNLHRKAAYVLFLEEKDSKMVPKVEEDIMSIRILRNK